MKKSRLKGRKACLRQAMATTLGEIIKPVGRKLEEDKLVEAYNDLWMSFDPLVEDLELSNIEVNAVLAKRLAELVAESLVEQDEGAHEA